MVNTLLSGIAAPELRPLRHCRTYVPRACQLLLCLLSCFSPYLEAQQDDPVEINLTVPNAPSGTEGVGMLFIPEHDGVQTIEVTRSTNLLTWAGFPPLTLAKLYDPSGNTIAVMDFTNQNISSETKSITFSADQPGIYHLSFVGGKRNDQLTLQIPPASAWGIAGEPGIGLSADLPNTLYLLTTPKSTFLRLSLFDSANKLEVRHEGSSLGLTSPVSSFQRLELFSVPKDDVLQIDLNNSTGSLFVAGPPLILCPSPEAARLLRAGVVKDNDDFLTFGPLQHRMREWMKAQATENLNVQVSFPASAPENLENPLVSAQLYGKYAPFGALLYLLDNQILDSSHPYFGFIDRPQHLPFNMSNNWQNGTYIQLFPINMQAVHLAEAAGIEDPMNPAYADPALIKRAVMAAFAYYVTFPRYFMLTEMNHSDTSVNSIYTFYAAVEDLIGSYYHLQPLIESTEEGELFKEAIMILGDKMANYKNYQSNQWSHSIYGVLLVYLATGEQRFLDHFARLVTSFTANTFGVDSNFGQHPTGFFLEDHGPDGNYEHLSLYYLANCYLLYKNLSEANPEVTTQLRNSIESSLEFQKYFWLPQPNGTVLSPNHMNTRTDTLMGSPSWPAVPMLSRFSDLAFYRYNLLPGNSSSENIPGFLTSDTHALKHLNTLLPQQGSAYRTQLSNERKIYNSFASGGRLAFSQPATATQTVLPVNDSGVWNPPGMIAWNDGNFYGMVFYNVEGSNRTRMQAKAGGGLSALWTPISGSIVLSMKNNNEGDIRTLNDITHTCVYGQLGNNLVYSETDPIQFIRNPGSKSWTIYSPFAQGLLRYDYTLHEDSLLLEISLNAPNLSQAHINIPVLKALNPVIDTARHNVALLSRSPDEVIEIQFPSASHPYVESSTVASRVGVAGLRVSIPNNGNSVSIVFRRFTSEPLVWAGYPSEDNVWVDTGKFLGWIAPEQNWIYSIQLDSYIYFPENFVTPSGGWTYFPVR